MRRNYFAGRDVAERYARSRPYFHPLVVRKIARLLYLDEPVHMALDVACGTGLSCAALTEITSRVNVIAAIEGGKDSLEDVHEWLVGSLTGLFRGSRAILEFGGYIWCLEAVPVRVDG